MKFIPYEPKHFKEILPTMKGVKIIGDNFDVLAEVHARYPATTAMDEDDKPLACFGITPLWNGVAIAWAAFRGDISDYGVTLFKGSKAFLDDLMESYHRIQCEVVASNEKAVKFIEKFGFEREATMRKYSPDEQDVYLYARVR